MEKNYIRIDFENCGLDYDYTICPFHEVRDQLEAVEIALVDFESIEEGDVPKVILTPVSMTEEDYKKMKESWED